VNALEHGNLEMDSSLKGDIFSSKDSYTTLLLERRMDPEFASRPIEVVMDATPERYEVVITDGGKGFDARKVSRVNDETLARQCGRGLAMIHMVMDEVHHNAKGNQIRMVLKKKQG
jgi:nitrogen fixation/metabolism regulation signal transduction histidine kinase